METLDLELMIFVFSQTGSDRRRSALHGQSSHEERQSGGGEEEGHGWPRSAADHEWPCNAHDPGANAEGPPGPQRVSRPLVFCAHAHSAWFKLTGFPFWFTATWRTQLLLRRYRNLLMLDWLPSADVGLELRVQEYPKKTVEQHADSSKVLHPLLLPSDLNYYIVTGLIGTTYVHFLFLFVKIRITIFIFFWVVKHQLVCFLKSFSTLGNFIRNKFKCANAVLQSSQKSGKNVERGKPSLNACLVFLLVCGLS